jgi:hypothetical protein
MNTYLVDRVHMMGFICILIKCTGRGIPGYYVNSYEIQMETN